MKFTAKTAKRNFFDRGSVVTAIGAARAKVLSRQGALVRKIMQRSMRKKKGPAPAGSPPHSHEGQLRDKTYFAYDATSGSCVVGPVKLGKSNAPEIQDKGGSVKVRGIISRKGEFIPVGRLSAASRQTVIARGKVVTKQARVEARPFSQPALLKAKPLLAKQWKGQVKGK